MSHHRLPLSPATPPAIGLKSQPQQKSPARVVSPPQSPNSPHMSVAIKTYVSAHENGQHTNEMVSRSPGPSTQPAQRQQIAQPSTSQSSTPSLKRPLPQGSEEQNSKRLKTQNSRSQDSQTTNVLEQEPTKVEIPVEEQASLLEELNTEEPTVQEGFFLTRRSKRKKTAVDISKNLLGQFSLEPLHASVARADPTTGEKINPIRKSYEGRIKDLKLPGRNKPHKQERIQNPEMSELRIMATVPEEQFQQAHGGKAIGDLSGIDGRLSQVLRFNTGSMAEKVAREWDEILGHDIKRALPLQQPFNGVNKVNGIGRVPPSAVAQSDDGRVRTRGKKRGYGDSSYEGYAEGHSDLGEASETDPPRKKRRD